MKAALFNPSAPKKPTNVSINSELLRVARERRINLSQALEQRLIELLREDQERLWREENRDAIDCYNTRIEAHGVWSDGLRRF